MERGAYRLGPGASTLAADVAAWRDATAIETIHDVTELKDIEIEKENMISKLNNHISKNMSLKGFICCCSSCKDIRNKDGVWTALEKSLSDKADLLFSHGICKKCARKLYPELFG